MKIDWKSVIAIVGLVWMLATVSSCQTDELVEDIMEDDICFNDAGAPVDCVNSVDFGPDYGLIGKGSNLASKTLPPFPTVNMETNIEGHEYNIDSLSVIQNSVRHNYQLITYEGDFSIDQVENLKENVFNSPAFEGIDVSYIKIRLVIRMRKNSKYTQFTFSTYMYVYNSDFERVSSFYAPSYSPSDNKGGEIVGRDFRNTPHIHTDLNARTTFTPNGQFPIDFVSEPIIGEGGLKSFRVIDPNNIRIHAQSTEDMYNAIIECWNSPNSDEDKCRGLEWLGGFDWEFTWYNGSLLTTINYAEYANPEDVGELIVQPTWNNTNPYGDDVYWEYYTFSDNNRYVFKLPQGKTFKVDGVEYYTDGDAGAKVYDLGNGITLRQSTYWNSDPWDFIYEENYWEVTWRNASYGQFWPNGNVVIDFSDISVIDVELD